MTTRPTAATAALAALLVGGTAFVAGAAVTGGPATAAPTRAAASAPVPVDDATLTWAVNKEAGSGAFAPGTWNLLSAGRVGDPGEGSRTLTTADEGRTWNNGATAGWSATDGDVVVEDLQADGASYAPTTFTGTRTDRNGVQVTAVRGNSENRLSFGAGSGTVDPATGEARIAWQGDATILFYSGMSFFYVADPVLDVRPDGTATLTAEVDGFASSMDDPEKWETLPAERVTVADLEGVEVDEDGFTVTPEYLGVEYTHPEGGTAQNRTAATWGSFPQDFVDFAQTTGAGPYWYSTGGSADPRKPAAPLTVTYDASTEPAAPAVTVSDTELLPSGAQEVTVSGTGFDPAAATGTRPPLAGRPGGVYVAFGKYDAAWRPSEGAPSSARRNVGSATRYAVLAEDMATVGGPARGAIELSPSGDFETTLTIDKAAGDALSEAGTLGVYTYAGSGAVAASYETATPLTFAQATPALTLSAPRSTYGTAARVTATVAGESAPTGEVALTRGGAAVGTADLVDGTATFALPRALAAGAHRLVASYAGDVNTAAGERATTLTVAKAATSVRSAITRKPTPRRAGATRVTVSSPSGSTLGGRAKVVLRTAAGTQVRSWTPAVRQGVATQALPKLAAGRYRLVVSYPGNANHAGSGPRTSTLTVR